MNLSATITIYAGGPGSGCNPDKGKCGRPRIFKTEGKYLYKEGKELVKKLSQGIPGTKFEIVGSVRWKGRSESDVDIKVVPDENYDHEKLLFLMSDLGFEWEGASTVSPKEKKTQRKNYGDKTKWSEIAHFRHLESNHKVELWYEED